MSGAIDRGGQGQQEVGREDFVDIAHVDGGRRVPREVRQRDGDLEAGLVEVAVEVKDHGATRAGVAGRQEGRVQRVVVLDVGAAIAALGTMRLDTMSVAATSRPNRPRGRIDEWTGMDTGSLHHYRA